jgi:hypothetical protein
LENLQAKTQNTENQMNTEMNPNEQISRLPRYQRALVYVVLIFLGCAAARNLIAWIERKGRKSLW